MTKARTRVGALAVSVAMGVGAFAAAAPSYADNAGASTTQAKHRYTYDWRTGKTTDPEASALLKQLQRHLPANYLARRAAVNDKYNVEPTPVEQVVLAQLTDEACTPTELDGYIERLIVGIPDSKLFVLAILGVFDYPTYDSLIYGDRSDPYYALETGTTGKVRQSVQASRAVWDIKSGDIQTIGMSSEMVVDRPKVIRLLQFLFGVTPAEAAQVTDVLIPLIKGTKQLRDGYNPLFTLNAFAFTAEGEPSLQGISDKIVMGDGIIKALRDTGNIAVGPQMVVSHEFGHHVQFENHAYPPGDPTPEITRRMELMADAYGAYLDAHAKGLNFGPARIAGTVEVAHLVGDCAVDNPGHHGTPSQRARAAAWGAALAKSNGMNVLPSRTVMARFDAALPGILSGARASR